MQMIISLDLKTQVAAMQDLQNTADGYGSTMFTKSLPMLQYMQQAFVVQASMDVF